MIKKIFVSHSSLDTKIGEKFVDLLIELGVPQENIFYSSRYHTGVEIGHDFHQEIKKHLRSSEIIIFLLTENFYNSPACLNEMGAAWILDKDICPILLGNLKPKDMQGFIDSHYIALTPKKGEEDILISKLSAYIDNHYTTKQLQDICSNFISEANKITESSQQCNDVPVHNLAYLEEAILNRQFTDAEIIVLSYFKDMQDNILNSDIDTKFDNYINQYNGLDINTAIRLLGEDDYIRCVDKYISDRNSICVYSLDMEYFRQLISLGAAAETYIENVKSRYKRGSVNHSAEEIVQSNSIDKFLLCDNIREIEILFMAYAYDNFINSFGDRWMAASTIASIENWEKNNNINNKLSGNYHAALSLLINRGMLEVASCTSYGNPREYRLKSEYLLDLGNMNSHSESLIKSTKENNYELYVEEEELPF